jgi:Cu(I)/Ag(I) efflux system periplasmic protein CusF
MNRKRFITFAALLSASALSLSVAAWAQTATAAGEVTKLDKAGSRITLKHGELKALDMPPMTMVFRVRDARLLDNVAVGDRVRFTAEKVDGSYTVTSIAKAP